MHTMMGGDEGDSKANSEDGSETEKYEVTKEHTGDEVDPESVVQEFSA